MLHPFVSSPQATHNSAPVLALSASVHVVLLSVALTSTGAVRQPHVLDAAAERVRFVEVAFMALASPVLRRAGRDERGRRASARPAFRLPPLLPSFDLVLPEAAPLPDYQPDLAALEIGGSTGLADDVLHLGLGPATSRRPPGALHNAYDDVAVEKRAVPVSANPKPHYPSRMRSRGIESNFQVYFVVDTSGIVDRQTVELPSSVQQEFTSAVAEVLIDWRFVPAELDGRRVRQRVLQPFVFRLEGQFSALRQP